MLTKETGRSFKNKNVLITDRMSKDFTKLIKMYYLKIFYKTFIHDNANIFFLIEEAVLFLFL